MSSPSNKQLTIAFYIDNFYFRGTDTAIYDYAHYNETILKNKSVILCIKDSSKENVPESFDKFLSRFPVYILNSMDELSELKYQVSIDKIYTIKYGTSNQGFNTNLYPLLVHCVYVSNDPHGEKYVGVSQSVSNKYVPHIVHSTNSVDNLRFELGIPKDAIVFGRHGGLDTFYLPDVDKVILNILQNYPNIYFIFMPKPNILHHINHPRLLELKSTLDIDYKNKFINTCDALLHAQILGETQGLSVLEFLANDKPVITWEGGRCKQHLLNLKNEGIMYKDMNELFKILTNWREKDKNYKHLVEPFSPENVMKKFEKEFL
jgi:hypothetical protein